MRRPSRKKRSSAKSTKPERRATVNDPLTQAFAEYWRNVNAGKNHTNAAIFVLRDYGIAMNDKQFRRCARRIKGRLGEVKGLATDLRDSQIVEHLVRHRFKEPVETWEQFDTAYTACGLPPSMLAPVKQCLRAEGYGFSEIG